MNTENNKSEPVDYVQNKNVAGKSINEKKKRSDDNGEIKEVDDKLIGDDLDIKEAQPEEQEDKVLGVKNEENNY